jgi:hypothetical protein
MAGVHARLSPSSAERWVHCPGSAALSDGLPDSGSDDARLGTLAHALAEHCLKSDAHPAQFLERTGWVLVDGSVGFLDPPPEEPILLVELGTEFIGHVNHYVQNIRQYAQGGSLLVEVSLPIGFLTQEPGARGTADAVIVTPDGELQVHDLKFGRGVKVAPEDNLQLAIYALAALHEFQDFYDLTSVRTVIHQVRVSPKPLEAVYTLEGLKAIGDMIRAAAMQAGIATESLKARGLTKEWTVANLHPGESTCKWCRAKSRTSVTPGAGCPALEARVQELVGASFAGLSSGNPAAQDCTSLDVDTLSARADAAKLIEGWIKAVRAEVERRLFAGEPVPGWKLVEGKQGPRAWSDATQAVAVMKSLKLKNEEMYDQSPISPTSAERLLRAERISAKQWARLQALITRAPGKRSVAPEDDPRPAVVLEVAQAEEFAGLDKGFDMEGDLV